jgi:hypothetical protein
LTTAKHKLWAFAFALSCFLDVLNAISLNRARDFWVPNFVVGVVALAVMLLPTRKWPLLLLAFSFAVNTVWHYPDVQNSNVMIALVSLVTLVETASAPLRSGALNANRVERIYSAARLVFVICYAAAAISKWNQEFFNPSSSCAVSIPIKGIESLAPWLEISPSQLWFMPAVIAVSETMVPVLLLVPRLRRWGVVWVLLLHTAISISPGTPYFSFTALIVAVCLLFLPTATSDVLAQFGQRLAHRRPLGIATQILFAIAGLFLLVNSKVGFFPVYGLSLRYILCEGVVLAFTIAVLIAIYKTRQFPMASKPFGISRWHLGVVAIVLSMAAEPYAGFGNSPTFTMFSNLHEENNTSNHFFMPRLNWGQFESGIVRLQGEHSPSRLISKFEFGEIVQEKPIGTVLHYWQNGERHSLRVTEATKKRLDSGWLTYRIFDTRDILHICQW